jgi:hypothetical protein
MPSQQATKRKQAVATNREALAPSNNTRTRGGTHTGIGELVASAIDKDVSTTNIGGLDYRFAQKTNVLVEQVLCTLSEQLDFGTLPAFHISEELNG